MSAAIHPFFGLEREQMEELLATAVNDMNYNSLKHAVYTLLSSYRPDLLDRPNFYDLISAAETIEAEDLMRTVTDENLNILLKKGYNLENAYIKLRSFDLEDGASIACSEECEGHSSAYPKLVEAAKRGTKKRKARSSRQEKATDLSLQEPYVAPPRVRDAERSWPFMRCKLVAKALWNHGDAPLPRSHYKLLEYIAKAAKLNLADLKKKQARVLFRSNKRVMMALEGR